MAYQKIIERTKWPCGLEQFIDVESNYFSILETLFGAGFHLKSEPPVACPLHGKDCTAKRSKK